MGERCVLTKSMILSGSFDWAAVQKKILNGSLDWAAVRKILVDDKWFRVIFVGSALTLSLVDHTIEHIYARPLQTAREQYMDARPVQIARRTEAGRVETAQRANVKTGANIKIVMLDALPQRRPLMPAVLLPEMTAKLPAPKPPLSPAQRLNLRGASLAKAESCLARAIYFEARDQPFRGQVGVAQVVMNRVFSSFYPNSICGVIYQNASHHLACQFTFACDGRSKVIHERGAWARAKRIARETLNGKLYVQAVGTATHYHATYVHPGWVREMRRLVREGAHTFYRPIAWGKGGDLPIYSRAELAANSKKQ
jgi:Cell Wall Hydrolase